MGVYDCGVADLYDRFVPAFFENTSKIFEIDFSTATTRELCGNGYVGSMNGMVILISHYTPVITPAYGLQPTANITTTDTALRCAHTHTTSYS